METARIILRPWQEDDAEVLFKYASDPELGPLAGWPPHNSVDESREVIRTIFSKEGMWAVVWKATGEPIGCVGYLSASDSNLAIEADTAEVGYWIARPYWGKGICTEALHLVIDHCFKEKGFATLWGCYFPDNPASGRVMEKCGFEFTGKEVLCPNLKVGAERPVKVMRLKKNTNKTTTIRRTIGITALVLWVIGILSLTVLGQDKLILQLDVWSVILAPVFTFVYSIMLTIHICKGKHWAIKLAEWIWCAFIFFFCIVVLFFAGICHDIKIWSSKDYVVYSEYGGFIDPDSYVLYKRKVLVNKRMHTLGSDWRGLMKKAEYFIYEPLDLIREEADVVPFSDSYSDSVYHKTVFYRLSDGKRYEEELNDSLQALIN